MSINTTRTETQTLLLLAITTSVARNVMIEPRLRLTVLSRSCGLLPSRLQLL